MGDPAACPPLRIAMCISFFPRGGSAYAVRSQAQALRSLGHTVDLYAGSLGLPGNDTHAPTFYRGLDPRPLTYRDPADEDGDAALAPLHASYERKAGAPDVDFADLPWTCLEAHVAAWERHFRAGARPDVLHLHHLTPMSVAARRVWPSVPVVTSLHGTELKWLERVATGRPEDAGAAPWAGMMREVAQASAVVTVLNEQDKRAAAERLGAPPERLVVLPGGVDTALFAPRDVSPAEQLAFWQHVLTADNRATDDRGAPVRYDAEQVAAAFGSPAAGRAFLFVGRYIGAKRLPQLLEAYGRLRDQLGEAAPPLVVWGGRDGECEGEHPAVLVERQGLHGVFFTGARGQDELAAALNGVDLLALPSVDESFGQVYVEAMASGVPILATRSGAPELLFAHQDPPVGWFVAADDPTSLTEALVDAATRPDVRAERGRNGLRLVRQQYTWERSAERLVEMYASVTSR